MTLFFSPVRADASESTPAEDSLVKPTQSSQQHHQISNCMVKSKCIIDFKNGL